MSTPNMPTYRISRFSKVSQIPPGRRRLSLTSNTDQKFVTDTFTKHHIDKMIPVEQLVKCKMQDNLDFLQWTKKFWDQYFPGGDYDAVARRKGGALPSGGAAARAPAGGAARRAGGTTPTTGPRV